MKYAIISIIATTIMIAGNLFDRSTYQIDPNNIPYTQLEGVYNTDALVEMGALLYEDNRLGVFGQSSCQASCHVKGNHLAPAPGSEQIALGGYTDFDGITQKAKYYPSGWVLDAPKINSPQAENLVFRKKVLHDCVTDPMGQASESFGLFAHNLDWTAEAVVNDEVYKHYANIIWGSDQITQERISKALVTFQESCVSQNNKFQDWANGGEADNRFYKWLELMETKCFTCHSGKDLGGEGLVMSSVVHKDDTDVSFLRSQTVAVRSLYNSDAFESYGWVGDYSTLGGFVKKHMEVESIDITYLERVEAIRGIREYLND